MNTKINGGKYDSSLEEPLTFYDHLPYERNLSVCGNDCIRLFSGNVIKYAACKEEEPKKIPNQDDLVLEKIKHQQEIRRMEAEQTETSNSENESGPPA